MRQPLSPTGFYATAHPTVSGCQSCQWVLPWISARCYTNKPLLLLQNTSCQVSCRSALRFYASLSGCKSICIPVLQISLLIRSHHMCPVSVWTFPTALWEMLVLIFRQLSKSEVQIIFFNDMQKLKYSNLISTYFK